MLTTLVLKDIKLELRTKTSLAFIISLALMLSVILALGINSAFLKQHEVQKLFPCLIWIVFFLTSTIVLGKSFDSELESRALDGMLLAGVSPSNIYLSKLISNVFITLIGHTVSFVTLALLLDISIGAMLCNFLFISVLVLTAFSALACIAVFIAGSNSSKALLLPLILLPLLFPCYFAALELSHSIFLVGTLDYSSYWVSLLIALDVMYIVLGLNFFHVLLKK